MAAPRVFISYSHDTPAHEERVLELSDRLRGQGVDAVIDQYETFPPDGWIQWMKRQVKEANFILTVCTETYRRRWDGEEAAGVGLGAAYEGQSLQQILYEDSGRNTRIVPVVLAKPDRASIPGELRRYTNFDLSADAGFQQLYRLLTDQPRVKKPVLGAPLVLRERKSDFRNLLWNVPPRNPFFTGRAANLKSLFEAASSGRPQAISGLGGLGKTQTAIEYAHRYRENYQAVFWMAAGSRDALLGGFAAVANLLDLPQKNAADLSIVVAAVRRWLESNPGWLLILDDIEDLGLAAEFAPAGAGGHVLLTTRLGAGGLLADVVELPRMEAAEGADFLLGRAKVKTPTEADRMLACQISEEVDGLPLALDQAAAFIEETPSTVAEYLELYRDEGAALRQRRGMAAGHQSVSITFSLAFQRAAAASPAAADIVRACAFAAPAAIPEEIFTDAAEEWGSPLAEIAARPLAWLDAIGQAGRFALVRRHAANKTLDVHRLVQEVVRDEMAVETRREWAGRAVEALSKIFPTPEFENWRQCERLLPHAKKLACLLQELEFNSASAGLLLHKSGWFLSDRAQYSEADSLCSRAVASYEKARGPDHADTAASLSSLAVLRRKQGRYAEAEPLYRRALAIRESALGPDHPNTATSLNNLAVLFNDQGRYHDAEPLYRRALAIREQALSPDHLDIANSLNNLASLYFNQGRYGDAEPMFARALAIREKALGPNHPDTAQSLNNLAELFHVQGRYREAEPLHRRALEIRETALGPDHPDTATSLNNLGLLYYNQARYQEAEPLYRRALAIREKVLGPDHRHTAQGLNNLAVLYDNAGRFADAESLYRRAMDIYVRSLGPEHADTMNCIRNYAILLRKLDRGAEADELDPPARAAGG